MMVRDTSTQAYRDIKPKLRKWQSAVLDVIVYLENPTNTEISDYTGFPINIITPRTNELVKKGFVYKAEKKKCSITGKMAFTWRVK